MNTLVCDLIEETIDDRDELLNMLANVTAQACWVDGRINSMSSSTYADAIRVLARHDRVVITHENGRSVIARWVGDE